MDESTFLGLLFLSLDVSIRLSSLMVLLQEISMAILEMDDSIFPWFISLLVGVLTQLYSQTKLVPERTMDLSILTLTFSFLFRMDVSFFFSCHRSS